MNLPYRYILSKKFLRIWTVLLVLSLMPACATPGSFQTEPARTIIPTNTQDNQDKPVDTPVSTEEDQRETIERTPTPEDESPPSIQQTLTPSPTSPPRETSTITLTPTPTKLAFAFEELAFFGGLPEFLTACVVTAETIYDGNPTLYYAGPEVIHEGSVSLCLLGFPLGSQLSVVLINPAGNEVDRLEFVQEDTRSLVDIIDIPLNIGLDIARGEWHAILDKTVIIGRNPPEVKQKEISFIVRPGNSPAMSIHREFSRRIPSPAAPERVNSLISGENVILLGDKFTPGMQVPLGLYQQTLEALKPVYSVILTIDDKGRFEHKFQLPPNLEKGWYRLIGFTNPDRPEKFQDQVLKNIYIKSEP